ncbi:MAG TPA: alpha/beta hydrolase [Stellaceae bacterium]|nr:alpha/beta hydrolase [Stellaceae bacterium]
MKTGAFQSVAGAIAFQESAGSGRPIVLIHGNSASSRAYLRQSASPLGERHRLVALDLPGHGRSADAADLSIYSLPGYAGILRAFAKAERLEDAIFVGWSLGGHIVLEAAPDLPKAAGFVIFGTPPLAASPAMEEAFRRHPAIALTFAAEMTREQAEAYVAAFFKPGYSDIPPSFVEDALRTDGRARAALGASLATGYRDEVAVVGQLRQPLAVLHGADEQLVNGGYFAGLSMPTLWRGAVQRIADAGHAPHWEQAGAFNALIDAFAEDCG